MDCFCSFKKRKKNKEGIRNELDGENNEKKEKKKKRGWWRRVLLAFRVGFLKSRHSPPEAPPPSASSSCSSSSAPPCLYLAPGRVALPRRCFSSSLVTSTLTPSPRRSSSAPPITSFSTPHVNPSPSTLHDVKASSYCKLDKEQERLSQVVIQGCSDHRVQRPGVFGKLLQVLKRSKREGRDHSHINIRQLGLPNIGSTCYMNATLQCLLSLTSFWTPIISQQASWMDNPSCQMLRSLAELQQARLSSTRKQKKQLLRALKNCLSARFPDFDGYYEQDAHEFLMCCLLQLKEEGEALRTSCLSYSCPVAQFEFQLRSMRTCFSCGLQSSKVEDYNHLSINLSSTLNHSLQTYFQPTDIDLYCKCGKGRRASEVQEFSTLPRVLILQVKRYNMLGYGEKLEDVMDFPAQLDLSELSAVASLRQPGSACPQASPQSSLKPAANERGEGQDKRGQQTGSVECPSTGVYKLHGVLSHWGYSLDSGHYICDVAEGEGDSWLTFKDSKVSRKKEPAVLVRRADTAYLLFYVHSGAGENNLVFWKRDQEAMPLKHQHQNSGAGENLAFWKGSRRQQHGPKCKNNHPDSIFTKERS